MTHQQQHEDEMWNAASHNYMPIEFAYDVIIVSTGTRCMSTDDVGTAVDRAEQLGDAYVLETESGRTIYAPPATDTQVQIKEANGFASDNEIRGGKK